MIFVGIDDTDGLDSKGTGPLARDVARELARSHRVFGVTRHQLLVHPEVPYTSFNRSSVVHVQAPEGATVGIFNAAKAIMLAGFVRGSAPGLAVADEGQVTHQIVTFGFDAKRAVVTRQRARDVAQDAGVLCEGLGGTQQGIIGAIAGIGLAHTGNDGRFVMKGRSRELKGCVSEVANVLASGIDRIETVDGQIVTSGLIDLARSATPSLVRGKAVLFVERQGGCYLALERE